MVSNNSTANDFSLAGIKDGGSANEVNARVVSTLRDVHHLLELYAPGRQRNCIRKKNCVRFVRASQIDFYAGRQIPL